jgi:hypothetical protein
VPDVRGIPQSDVAMCIVILKGLNCLAVTYSVTDLISKGLSVFQNGNEFCYLHAHGIKNIHYTIYVNRATLSTNCMELNP